jgi:predicted metalloprotease
LQQKETITENHNQAKCRVVEPEANAYIFKRNPALRAQGTLQRREQKYFKNQREFAVRPCSLVISESSHIKSHQHNCLNMV